MTSTWYDLDPTDDPDDADSSNPPAITPDVIEPEWPTQPAQTVPAAPNPGGSTYLPPSPTEPATTGWRRRLHPPAATPPEPPAGSTDHAAKTGTRWGWPTWPWKTTTNPNDQAGEPSPPPPPPTPPNPTPTTNPRPTAATTPWWEGWRDWPARAWAWHIPGGGGWLWAPVGWVWRWRATATIVAAAAVWVGASPEAIITACVGYIGAIVVLAAPAATRQRVASLRVVSVYRKRRRWIRSRWVEMMANGALIRAKAEGETRKRMPELKSLSRHPHGVACRVDASHAGYGAGAFIGVGAALYNTVKARSIRVSRVEAGRHQGDVVLTVKWDDPFPFTIRNEDIVRRLEEIRSARRLWFWQRHRLVLNLYEPVVGLDEEAWPTTLDVRKPLLVVAASGHGKSTLLWQVLWALKEAGLPVLASVFDPKGGMELGELRKAAWRYVSRSADWPDFVAAEAAALEADQLRAASEGLQDVPWDEDHPLRLIVVDELVTALMSSRGQDAKIIAFGMERTTQQAFAVLMSQMRAANRSMTAMSTNAEKDVLGAARTMFPQTALGRVASTEKAAVDIMLGAGAHGAYPAHELDPKDMRMRGRFWMRVGGEVTYFRGAQLTADERQQVARWMQGQTDKYRARGFVDPVPPRSLAQAKAQARAQGAQQGVQDGAQQGSGGRAPRARKAAAGRTPAGSGPAPEAHDGRTPAQKRAATKARKAASGGAQTSPEGPAGGAHDGRE